VPNTEYDQGLRNHVDKLKKCPVIDGGACFEHYPFVIPDVQAVLEALPFKPPVHRVA
jgi:hypothetical protein